MTTPPAPPSIPTPHAAPHAAHAVPVLVDPSGAPFPPEALRPGGATAMHNSYTNGGARSRHRPGRTGPKASGKGHRDPRTTETLIRDCQQAARNNLVARALLNARITCVVGADTSVQARSADKRWNREAEARFAEWSHLHADVTRQTDLNGLAAQLVENGCTDGDTLVVKVVTGSGAGTRLGLELVEGLRVANRANSQDTRDTHGGVELRGGVPVGYRVHDWNDQGTMLELGGGRLVPASDAWMVPNPRDVRAGSYRTMPALSLVVDRLEVIDKSDKAAWKAYEIASSIALLITRDLASGQSLNRLQAQAMVDAELASSVEQAERDGVEWDYGTAHEFAPGESAQGFKPEHPVTGFDVMLWTELQAVCAALDINLELAFAKHDKSWAASRSAIASTWKNIAFLQRAYRVTFLDRVYRAWLQTEIHAGRLEPVEGYDRFEWVQPAPPVLDREREFKGQLVGLSGGLTTHDKALRELGMGDRDGFMEQFRLERKENTEAGLTYADPVQTTKSEQVDADGEPVGAGQEGGGDE